MQVLPQQSGTSQRGNAWRKQEYVMETFDRFPRKIFFGFFGDAIDQYPLAIGDDIRLSFDLESRSYIGRDGVERWSTDVRAWKAEKIDASQLQAQGYGAPASFNAPAYGVPQAPQAQPYAPQPAPAVGQFDAAPISQPAAAPNATEDLPF